MKVIKEIKDLRYLEWTKTRHSSGTAGSFLKSMEKTRGRKYYYKLSDYDPVTGISGNECINEIIADRLLGFMDIPHLEYTLIHALICIKARECETYLLRSEDFKHKGESKSALDAFYDVEAEDGEPPLDFCVRMGFAEYIYTMLVIDFLILNRDRHGANIEVLKDPSSKSLRCAPLFDHGLSMLFKCRDDEECLAYDPYDEKKVQCFVGGNNAYENLKLIPKEYLFKLPDFDDKLKHILFEDLDEAVSPAFIECTWNFLKARAAKYEDFCNQKR